MDALARRYRVMAIDLPGFGASTKVALGSLEQFENFLAYLLESQGLTSAHVVGHSFGGLLALGLALDQPHLVRSLTVLATAGMGPTTTDFRSKMVTAQSREEIRQAVSMAFHDPVRFNDVIDRSVEVQLAYRAEAGVLALLAKLGATTDAWISAVQSRLAEIKVPMLVLWGTQDRATPAAHADRVRGLPNAEVHLFEGAGHAAQLEAADAFNVRLLAFLDAQSDRARQE
jgi:pyruvate dehydrogenase E2 component (dihydrolipoamide acetyltransferase)